MKHLHRYINRHVARWKYIWMDIMRFFFQRIPKLQQHDQAVWWDTLGKMQKLLRKAALSLGNSGKIDKDTMHNYFMSGETHLKFAW